jgi:hypothetical protein
MCLQYNNYCKITKFIVKTREVDYTVVRFMDSESHARTWTVRVKNRHGTKKHQNKLELQYIG